VKSLLALALVLASGTAMAGAYSGKYPVTLTHAMPGNGGTYCLTLVDNGSVGWPHSGQASLSSKNGTLPYGSFQLIGGFLVATIQSSSDTGDNAGLVFIAPVSNGVLGAGTFDEVYGGEEMVSAVATFGAKNGC
jgi:hypothetical protein